VDGASGLAVPCFGRTLEIWTLNIYRPYKDRARKCTNTTSTQTHTRKTKDSFQGQGWGGKVGGYKVIC
jgi:hypothetical protein